VLRCEARPNVEKFRASDKRCFRTRGSRPLINLPSARGGAANEFKPRENASLPTRGRLMMTDDDVDRRRPNRTLVRRCCSAQMQEVIGGRLRYIAKPTLYNAQGSRSRARYIEKEFRCLGGRFLLADHVGKRFDIFDRYGRPADAHPREARLAGAFSRLSQAVRGMSSVAGGARDTVTRHGAQFLEESSFARRAVMSLRDAVALLSRAGPWMGRSTPTEGMVSGNGRRGDTRQGPIEAKNRSAMTKRFKAGRCSIAGVPPGRACNAKLRWSSPATPPFGGQLGRRAERRRRRSRAALSRMGRLRAEGIKLQRFKGPWARMNAETALRNKGMGARDGARSRSHAADALGRTRPHSSRCDGRPQVRGTGAHLLRDKRHGRCASLPFDLDVCEEVSGWRRALDGFWTAGNVENLGARSRRR